MKKKTRENFLDFSDVVSYVYRFVLRTIVSLRTFSNRGSRVRQTIGNSLNEPKRFWFMNVFIAENFRRGEKCSVPRSNDAEPYFPLFCLLYAYIAADFGYVWQTFVLYFLTLLFRAINMTQLKFYNANIMRNSHENPLKP